MSDGAVTITGDRALRQTLRNYARLTGRSMWTAIKRVSAYTATSLGSRTGRLHGRGARPQIVPLPREVYDAYLAEYDRRIVGHTMYDYNLSEGRGYATMDPYNTERQRSARYYSHRLGVIDNWRDLTPRSRNNLPPKYPRIGLYRQSWRWCRQASSRGGATDKHTAVSASRSRLTITIDNRLRAVVSALRNGQASVREAIAAATRRLAYMAEAALRKAQNGGQL